MSPIKLPCFCNLMSFFICLFSFFSSAVTPASPTVAPMEWAPPMELPDPGAPDPVQPCPTSPPPTVNRAPLMHPPVESALCTHLATQNGCIASISEIGKMNPKSQIR